jgi:hypothetical protein
MPLGKKTCDKHAQTSKIETEMIILYNNRSQQTKSMKLIIIEQPPLVGEVSAKFCG